MAGLLPATTQVPGQTVVSLTHVPVDLALAATAFESPSGVEAEYTLEETMQTYGLRLARVAEHLNYEIVDQLADSGCLFAGAQAPSAVWSPSRHLTQLLDSSSLAHVAMVAVTGEPLKAAA